jgi:hypothetical protein
VASFARCGLCRSKQSLVHRGGEVFVPTLLLLLLLLL